MVLKGKTPTMMEREHMRNVRDLGCIVCQLEGLFGVPAEIHHIEGKTKKNSHLKILPLCFNHHRAGYDGEKNNFISRHPYKARFTEKYGSEYDLLKKVQKLLANP